MAHLTSNGLTLDVRYREFDRAGWVQYEISFQWHGQPLINDALLKRRNVYWQARSPGAFKASQYRADDLIATLERILATDTPDYWQPLDPDVTIAVYPHQEFPFLPSHYRLVRQAQTEQVATQRQPDTQIRQHPSDVITIIVAVDTYNLEDADTYSSDSIALIMCPTRAEVAAFLETLKQEYAVFTAQFKVDEYREDDGNVIQYRPPTIG